MKKTYIQPTMTSVKMTANNIMQASGQLNGLGTRISNSETTNAAESRGGSAWDDED